MNCKPGDLARVIAPGRFIRCRCGNKVLAVKPDTFVVVTTSFTRSDDGGTSWTLETPINVNAFFPCGAAVFADCIALEDELLRPIRDPGEDAVDEVLQLAGAPNYGEVMS